MHLQNRSSGQVKNQFFNIVRTLLRKAFKKCFKTSNTVIVSEIKPKVLSEIVNLSLSNFNLFFSDQSKMTVKTFLVDYLYKSDIEAESTVNVTTLKSIRTYMINAKLL